MPFLGVHGTGVSGARGLERELIRREQERESRKDAEEREKARLLPVSQPVREEGSALVPNSLLYKEFLAERAEILKYQQIESEKAGHEIDFEKALLGWIVKHRDKWRKENNIK